MAIFNFWGKLRQNNSTWDSAVEQTAALSVVAVMPRLSHQAQGMTPAERYGYIRAHASSVVHRYTTQALAQHSIRGTGRRRQFAQVVMQRVIDLVGLQLAVNAQSTRPRSGRQAA